MKQTLLLVDADARSRRVLEVSLRKAGYTVAVSDSAEDALTKVTAQAPDLILADTKLPGQDGFGLMASLRKDPSLRAIPFMFLSSDSSIESKVRGLELGVEYLTKPMYIREVITRVSLELERRQRKVIELKPDQSTRFAGSLSDMGLVDLLQTIDLSRKSGTLRIRDGQREGYLWFREGQVVDAEVGKLRGEQAVYRFLVRSAGTFELTFGEVVRPSRVNMSSQGLLLEGMRRIDEWGRVIEQLPPLESVLEVQEDVLVEQLAQLPDAANAILKLVDGERTLASIVEDAHGDDLETLRVVSELYFEGLVAERDGEFPRMTASLQPGKAPLTANDEETSPRASIPAAEAPKGSHSAETQRPPPSTATTPPPRSAQTVMLTSDDFVSAKPTVLRSQNPESKDTIPDAAATAEPAKPDSAAPRATPMTSTPPQTGHTLRPSSPSADLSAAAAVAPAAAGNNVIPFPMKIAPAVPTDTPAKDASATKGTEAVPAPKAPRRGGIGDVTLPGVAGMGVGSISRDDLLAEVVRSKSVAGVNLPTPVPARDPLLDGSAPSEEAFFSTPPPSPMHDSWVDLNAPTLSPETRKVLFGLLALLGGGAVVCFVIYFGFLTAPKQPTIGEDHSVIQPTPPPMPEAPAAEEQEAIPASPVKAKQRPEAEEPVAPKDEVAVGEIKVVTADPAPATPAAAAPDTPPTPAATPVGDYPALLARASLLEEARKLRNAEQAYREAIAANAEGSEALSNLAFLLLNRSRFQEASELAKRAAAVDPTNSKAWITLGASLQALGKSSDAKSAYEACALKGKGAFVRDCRLMLR